MSEQERCPACGAWWAHKHTYPGNVGGGGEWFWYNSKYASYDEARKAEAAGS